MIQIIRNGGLGGFILGLLIIVLSKSFFDIVPDFPQVTYTPFFAGLKDRLANNPILDICLGISFIILQASLFTFLLNYHKVTKERSLFPFILYVLFAGVYSEQFYLNPASFLNFFLILILDRMLRLQDVGKEPGTLFLDIGLLIGISILFSKEAVFYVPFIYIGVIIISTSNINSILIMLLTSLVVIGSAAGLYYFIGGFQDFSKFFAFTPLSLGIGYSHWQERFFILLIIFVLLSVISYIYFQFANVQISNKSKRFVAIFILFWFVALLLVLFQKLNLWYNTALIVIPLTVFSSIFFQDDKGKDWFKNLVFFILIIGIISVQANY